MTLLNEDLTRLLHLNDRVRMLLLNPQPTLDLWIAAVDKTTEELRTFLNEMGAPQYEWLPEMGTLSGLNPKLFDVRTGAYEDGLRAMVLSGAKLLLRGPTTDDFLREHIAKACDFATLGMVGMAMGHLAFIRHNGWDAYVEARKKAAVEDGTHGS